MIVVTNEFHVDPAYSEEFEERFRNRLGDVTVHEVAFDANGAE